MSMIAPDETGCSVARDTAVQQRVARGSAVQGRAVLRAVGFEPLALLRGKTALMAGVAS